MQHLTIVGYRKTDGTNLRLYLAIQHPFHTTVGTFFAFSGNGLAIVSFQDVPFTVSYALVTHKS